MTHSHADDLLRIKELLNHTGEFIAYFELAETKMLEWREEIAYHTQTLQSELSTINARLSQTGIEQFKFLTEQFLAQSALNLQQLQQNNVQFSANCQHNQTKLHELTEQCLARIDQHSQEATQHIRVQLSQYDAQQFHRIASESCDHVARITHNAVHKSNKLLALFQLRFGVLIVLISLLTAFVMGLYLNDELPWELHHRAKNERHAGKVLLQAWPNLSPEEKAKILNGIQFKPIP